MDSRVTWDEYFMNIARVVATRATCDRKHVGAVLVRDKTILSTGYNGSIRGLPHCTEVGCLMENDHCVRTVHAEANAILQAARHGVRIEGADIYVSDVPGMELVAEGVDPRALVLLDGFSDERERPSRVPSDPRAPSPPTSRIFVYALNVSRLAGNIEAIEREITTAMEREITATFLEVEQAERHEKELN